MGRVQSRRRIALIVEDDAELRLLTTMVLEESELDIIECESAEAALATMLLRGQNVAMIFADIRLSGVMDGIDSDCHILAACRIRAPQEHRILLAKSRAGLAPGTVGIAPRGSYCRNPIRIPSQPCAIGKRVMAVTAFFGLQLHSGSMQAQKRA
jgi:hypothetical protein